MRLHYVHTFNPVVDWGEIPLPELFLWALYNKTLTYIYPQYWQYWDGKDTTAYSKYQEQMENFNMIDSLQITWVESNVN
jgi:hypothetical protein